MDSLFFYIFAKITLPVMRKEVLYYVICWYYFSYHVYMPDRAY